MSTGPCFQLNAHRCTFLQVLGTEELRAWADGRNPDEKPVRSDFVAKNGLQVHVLDDNVFRAHHFDIDRPYAARDQSVVSDFTPWRIECCGMLTPKVAVSQFLHMTCGDDTPTKVYAAKTQVSNRAVPTNSSDDTNVFLAGFLAGPRGVLHRAATDDHHRTPLGLARSRHADAQNSTRGGVSLFSVPSDRGHGAHSRRPRPQILHASFCPPAFTCYFPRPQHDKSNTLACHSPNPQCLRPPAARREHRG